MDIKSSDAEIISTARSGDLMAFEMLYKKYERQVYHTAVAIVGNRQAAEEILQDCFLRAYKHLDKLNGDPSIRPWLHRVTINLCYSRLRRNYLAQLTVPLENISHRLFPTAALSPEEKAYHSEIQAAIREGIASLGFNHRAVIVLHYLQGFSLEEIAYILQCPMGTVKSRLYHARKLLGQRLASLHPQVAYELA